MKCLNPKCQSKGTRRGLCLTCYQVARALVIANQTTWEALEAKGKVKPLRTAGSIRTAAMHWMLSDEITPTPNNETK